MDDGRAGRHQFAEATASAGPLARDQIVAVFGSLVDWLASPGVRGCPWQIALAEFPEPASPERVRAAAAKAWLLHAFEDLAAAHCTDTGGSRDSERLGRQLFVVYEGLYASALSADPTELVPTTMALIALVLDAPTI
ncbi:MAG TPA: hypothetical protein VHZ81_08970 [Galbitalea sp.]|nr:hypothetical protein [Galbitalea sp.]